MDTPQKDLSYFRLRLQELLNTELYHIGASLKDLGKKWFAFSRMDIEVGRMLKILNKQ